jgi:serine/threonine protein kinase
MENQQPSSKPTGKTKSASEKAAPGTVPAPDTRMVNDTATPGESDPLWEQLGSTRVVEGQSDSSLSGVSNLDSPSNHTELSPSLILGKNLTTLGDFQFSKKLGEGAMGAVYKALQISINGEKLDKPRTVAVKVLFPHVANIPKLVERLHREGRVMGSLDHPNIVQAYAIGEAEGCHYVAMEYVSGQSMQKWLGQLGFLPVADAVRITLDCAKALAYAHAKNIVHRDIKPDNILLTKTGIVKVADLGMVKIDDEEMSLTQTGHAVGTPWYMPIEQARNAKEIDGRSDIYALGCTLYAFLTGQPPFVGRTIVEVIQAKEKGTFPPARQTSANVPERLDLILVKMTAKLPKNRYQTCEELIKDLESLKLASVKLSFIQQKPVAPAHVQETPMPGKTSVMASIAKTHADAQLAEVAAPSLDPDVWYVQVKMGDGKVAARKYTTAQLKKMLAEGTIGPTASISHSPNDGFRTLATFKEFQGAAMSKMAKKAADKNTARYRGVYKKLDEEDRQHVQKERAAKKADSSLNANTRYWMSLLMMVLPFAVGLAVVVGFIYWMSSMFM